MTYFYLYWYIKVSLTSYNLQEQKPRLDPLQLWRALGWNVSIIAQIAQSPESLRVEKVYEATLSTPGNFNISLSIKKQSSSDTCSSSGQSCWSSGLTRSPSNQAPGLYTVLYTCIHWAQRRGGEQRHVTRTNSRIYLSFRVNMIWFSQVILINFKTL